MHENVSIIPMMGCFPISHMGHAIDMATSLNDMPGKKLIGLSAKNGVFTPEERVKVIEQQWGGRMFNAYGLADPFMVVKSPGEVIAAAYNEFYPFTSVVLHILVGHDRLPYGEGLRNSIMNGKIPELEGGTFLDVIVTTPRTDRTDHDYSGTRLRKAVAGGDWRTFEDHMGSSLSDHWLTTIWGRMHQAYQRGDMPLKRT